MLDESPRGRDAVANCSLKAESAVGDTFACDGHAVLLSRCPDACCVPVDPVGWRGPCCKAQAALEKERLFDGCMQTAFGGTEKRRCASKYGANPLSGVFPF